MLTDLTIRNLALIEEARLSFGSGLNAITGETGAGKSLLVSSLELLSGERLRRGSAPHWVRDGADRAEVEGRFCLADEQAAHRIAACLQRVLPAFVPEWEEEDAEERELLLARTVDARGRTRAWINHRPVTRQALHDVASALFEIHGQNTHQQLLDPERQVRWLDAAGGLESVRARYVDARDTWRSAERRLRLHREERSSRRERLALLRARCDELTAFEPVADEPEALKAERQRLRHGTELAREGAAWLDALSEGESAACDRLRSVEREICRWLDRIEELEGVVGELEAARVHLEEATASLLSFSEDLELDPRRLEWVEGRLAEYERLARLYEVPVDRLAEIATSLQEEADTLCAVEDGLDDLIAERDRAFEALGVAAEELRSGRRECATPLTLEVEQALGGLGLKKARLEIAFEEAPEAATATANATGSEGEADERAAAESRFGPLGPETVEFLLAANPGERPRPLREVASGGEMARIVLALRSALAGREGARVLIFDEIDTGVGGRLGPALGGHLRGLGEHHQVLTVTHLPAIAASAHQHQVVRKAVRRGRTRTAVALLEGDARIHEVADMIAGGGEAATAQAEARRLLGVSETAVAG